MTGNREQKSLTFWEFSSFNGETRPVSSKISKSLTTIDSVYFNYFCPVFLLVSFYVFYHFEAYKYLCFNYLSVLITL